MLIVICLQPMLKCGKLYVCNSAVANKAVEEGQLFLSTATRGVAFADGDALDEISTNEKAVLGV